MSEGAPVGIRRRPETSRVVVRYGTGQESDFTEEHYVAKGCLPPLDEVPWLTDAEVQAERGGL